MVFGAILSLWQLLHPQKRFPFLQICSLFCNAVSSLMWNYWKSISKIQTGEASLEGFWCDRMVFGAILSFWSPIWEILRGARTSKCNEIELASQEIQGLVLNPDQRFLSIPDGIPCLPDPIGTLWKVSLQTEFSECSPPEFEVSRNQESRYETIEKGDAFRGAICAKLFNNPQ